MARTGALSWVYRLLVSAMLIGGVAQVDTVQAARSQAVAAKQAGAKKATGKKGSAKSTRSRKSVSASATRTGGKRVSRAPAGSSRVATRAGSGRKAVASKASAAAKTTKIGNKKSVSASRSKKSATVARAVDKQPVRMVAGKIRKASQPARSSAGVVAARPQERAAARRASVRESAAMPVAASRMVHRSNESGVSARKVSVAGSERLMSAPAELSPAVASGSLGEAIGLNRIPDPLALRSSVALVVDPRTGKILYDKNSSAVLPIASVTKLMTAMVVLDAGQPLDEKIRIDAVDRDMERFSSSHLPVGSELTRAELLQLALMSSENRAASALARSYPGGLRAFVDAANRKARDIGMWDSVFMDPTGLSASNVSTARDLAVLVARASRYPEIRRFSVAPQLQVRTAYGTRVFHTTNPLVGNSQWGLTLQKTGFINEAGNCLVMQARVNGRQTIIVLLDSQGRYARVSDANRIRRFIEG